MNSPCVILPFSLLLALLASGCRKEVAAPAPLNVRTTPAQPSGASARESGPAFLGVVRGENETNLSFKVSGQLVRIGPRDGGEDWSEGVTVAADTELAQLDTANFVSAVSAARARAELARATFARNSELYTAANLSKNEFEASRAQKETADADLAQAEQALRDTTLRAPYGGVILSRTAKSGEFASAGKPVLRIGDFRRVTLEVGVPDTLLRDIRVGQSYAVRVSAFEGEMFTGTLTEIGTAASESSRLFRVALKLDNVDGRLKSGMTATVRLGGANLALKPGVLVPLSALVATTQSGGGSAVFVVEPDNIARARIVATADIVGSSIIVTAGVKAGEPVVTLGAGQLFDGAAVRVSTLNK